MYGACLIVSVQWTSRDFQLALLCGQILTGYGEDEDVTASHADTSIVFWA